MTLSIRPAKLLACLFLCLLCIAACQKGPDNTLPDPNPAPSENIVDSSQLIKSIARTSYSHNSQYPPYSNVEYYDYDTVNRKINISWDASDDYPAGTHAVLSYNPQNLLESISYTYAAGSAPQDGYYSDMLFTYDATGILSTIVSKTPGRSQHTTIFKKQIIPQVGYSLTWDIVNSTDYSLTHVALFNNNGECLGQEINEIENSRSYTQRDSFAFDANRNITKTFNRSTNFSGDIKNTIPIEFSTRVTGGDQLFKQRELIMSGIAEIPFQDDDDFVIENIGVLSRNQALEYQQYSKNPMTSAKILGYNGEDFNFTGQPTIDAKGRLTLFKGYSLDIGVDPIEYNITYFK